jgi:uncharacterized repeat protein (TIGR01451 family)
MKKEKTSKIIALVLAFGLIFSLTAGLAGRSLAAQAAVSGQSYITASQETLMAGETLTFAIHVINNSVTEATANVSDKIPAELAYVANSVNLGGVYTAANRLVAWDNVKVPALAEVVLTFDVELAAPVQASVEVVNIASIQVIGQDGLGQILNSAVKITLLPGEVPEPEVVNAFKTASSATLTPGGQLTYTIQITNSGVDPVIASVMDKIPTDLIFVDGSQNLGGVYDPLSSQLSWRIVDVPAMSETRLTFDVQAAAPSVSQPVEVTNQATVVVGDLTLTPEVKITIVPGPSSPEIVRPEVLKIQVGEADVLTDPSVILHIDATPGTSWMFIREYSLKVVFDLPVWTVDHSSGWIPFQADFPWKLGNVSGAHSVGVVVADADLNRSLWTHHSFDFASLNLPGTTTHKPGLIPYMVYYPAGVNVSLNLAPATGNGDLYVWYPGNFDNPDQALTKPGTAIEAVTFTTPKDGIYIILVHAVEPITYNLTITPAGGPSAPVTGLPAQAGPQAVSYSAFTQEPVFSTIGIDPLGIASEILFVRIQLPIVR